MTVEITEKTVPFDDEQERYDRRSFLIKAGENGENWEGQALLHIDSLLVDLMVRDSGQQAAEDFVQKEQKLYLEGIFKSYFPGLSIPEDVIYIPWFK